MLFDLRGSESLSPGTFRRLMLAGAVLWTALVGVSLAVNLGTVRQQAVDLAVNEARGSFEKDLSFRLWATSHGGVYVVPDDHTPPNPWLAHIPDRDVITTSGKRLTLMNPAYMLRQMMEDFAPLYGAHSHITSLKPRNPANAADEWEASALRRFDVGEREVYEIVGPDGAQSLRLMRPMMTEAGCLKCHADQGYRVGDVRGGVSVTVPLASYFAVVATQSRTLLWGHGGLWLLGLLGIGFGGRDGGRRIRRHLEAVSQLAESERHFRATIDLAGIGISSLGLDGTWLTVNKRLCEITGYEADELIGRRFVDLTHPDDRPASLDFVERLLAGTPARAVEKRYIRKDGQVVWVSVTSTVAMVGDAVSHIISATEDITARKESERELRLTKFAVDHIHDGVAWLDAAGHLVYVNDAICRLHGLGREQLLRMSVGDVTPGRSAEAWAAHWAELVRLGSLSFETECRHADGTMIPIEVSANLLKNEGIEFCVSFVRDIRGRRQAEADMRRSIDELSRSNAELERFAYIASHDLQEPSRSVVSFAQLLERRLSGRLEDDERELLGYLQDGARRMHDLVRDLLSYSRVSGRAEAFTTVDLSEVVGQVRDSLRALIEESDAEIVVSSLPQAAADHSQMVMLFQNLLANAIKFRAPGIRPLVAISAAIQDGRVIVSVADNGIGIDPAYREEVFVIFKRLHTAIAYPGTGIGLAVCKRIVERHHGRIWVEPNAGGGSVFRFTLPPAAETA